MFINLMEFNIDLYKKYNKDLKNLNDDELINHFNKIGKYQLRIYYNPSFFNKEIIYIYTNKFSYYISNVLKYLLFKNFYLSIFIDKINIYNNNLHIIPFSQKVNLFPKKYIIYQLEQKDISNFINKKYESNIENSYKTWDYSQSNIDKFSDKIKKKMIYFPIPIIPICYLENSFNINIEPENDILFFGILNENRKNKLNYLKRNLNCKFKIISNAYGKKLYYEILNSKIIINIHFYEDAILETYRINEVLSCKRVVISELPNLIDNINYQLYKNKIIFVKNLNEMILKINENLNNYKKTDISMFNIKEFNNYL